MNQQSKNAIDTLLAESLKELAVTRPIDKITIKEITDKAGVIRPTFYNHFQDKYELLEWIVRTELMQPMIPLVSGGMIREGVMLALKKISSEKGFYTQAVRLTGQNSFADILKLELLVIFIVTIIVPGFPELTKSLKNLLPKTGKPSEPFDKVSSVVIGSPLMLLECPFIVPVAVNSRLCALKPTKPPIFNFACFNE